MISDIKLQFLNELTDMERSIFLYCFVFSIPQVKAARHLKVSLKVVRKLVKQIRIEIDVNRIQGAIMELHELTS